MDTLFGDLSNYGPLIVATILGIILAATTAFVNNLFRMREAKASASSSEGDSTKKIAESAEKVTGLFEKDNERLRKRVDELEEKVKQLEARLENVEHTEIKLEMAQAEVTKLRQEKAGLTEVVKKQNAEIETLKFQLNLQDDS